MNIRIFRVRGSIDLFKQMVNIRMFRVRKSIDLFKQVVNIRMFRVRESIDLFKQVVNIRMFRVRESIDLFKQVVNNTFFNHSSCILFLNKKDIFLKKINQVPVVDWTVGRTRTLYFHKNSSDFFYKLNFKKVKRIKNVLYTYLALFTLLFKR